MKRAISKTLPLFLLVCNLQTSNAQAPSHKAWDALLKKHVAESGKVNYTGFVKDSAALNRYLAQLSKNPPQSSWDVNDRLAYWINAYNAFTVQLIVRNYPVKSIKDLGGRIYKVNTPWDIKFIRIGGKRYDLNNIEHGIIRKQFSEPRIHFAVNCASASCPDLRNEAYTGSQLNRQLDEQARRFINDPRKNKISPSGTQLSKIFSWFQGDFTKKGYTIVEFVNKYAKVKISDKTKISYLDYLWTLNE